MHATSDWLTPPVEQQQSLPRTRVPSFDGREESKYLFNTYEDIQKDLLKSLLHFAGSHARVSEWCGLGIQAAALQPLTRWSERPAVHKVRFSRLHSFISSPSHNTIHQPLCTTLANHRENVTSSPLPSTFITSYPDSLLYWGLRVWAVCAHVAKSFTHTGHSASPPTKHYNGRRNICSTSSRGPSGRPPH